jgi:hypothetical protein
MKAKNLYFCQGCYNEGLDPYWHNGRIGIIIQAKESDAIRKKCTLHEGLKC